MAKQISNINELQRGLLVSTYSEIGDPFLGIVVALSRTTAWIVDINTNNEIIIEGDVRYEKGALQYDYITVYGNAELIAAGETTTNIFGEIFKMHPSCLENITKTIDYIKNDY